MFCMFIFIFNYTRLFWVVVCLLLHNLQQTYLWIYLFGRLHIYFIRCSRGCGCGVGWLHLSWRLFWKRVPWRYLRTLKTLNPELLNPWALNRPGLQPPKACTTKNSGLVWSLGLRVWEGLHVLGLGRGRLGIRASGSGLEGQRSNSSLVLTKWGF